MTTAELQTGRSAPAHHLPAALVAAAVVAVLVLPSVYLGSAGRVGAVVVVQSGFVVAWVTAVGLEGRLGSLVIGAAATAGADAALMLPARPELGGLLAVLGIGFLAAVLQQMLRRSREELVASLSGELLMICALCGFAALLVLDRSASGRRLAVTGLLAVGAALVVGHLVDLILPRPALAPGIPRGLTALVLAILAGAGAAYLRRGPGTLAGGLAAVIVGMVLGAVAALVAVAGSYAAIDVETAEHPPPPWSLPVMQALLPVAAAAPVALALQGVL